MPRFSRHRAVLFFFIAAVSVPFSQAEQLAPPGVLKGATEKQVIAAIGWPTGRATADDRVIWSYPGYQVVFQSGKVEVIRPVAQKNPLRYPQLPPIVLSSAPSQTAATSTQSTVAPARATKAPVTASRPPAQSAGSANSAPVRSTSPDADTPNPDPVAPFFKLVKSLGIFVVVTGIVRLILRRRRSHPDPLLLPRAEASPAKPDAKKIELRPLRLLASNQGASAALTEDASKNPDLSPHLQESAPPERDRTRSIPIELSLETLVELEWKRFEELAAYFFASQGWKTKLGTTGPDGGVDVRLTHRDDANRRAYVQCKAWVDHQLVGVKPVRELFGVMAADGVAEGWFLTTSDFTAEARDFATGKQLTLINGRQLVQAFNKLPTADQRRTLDQVFRGDYHTPSCPNCGTKMVEKGSDEPFWGCRNFPRCRGKLNARRV